MVILLFMVGSCLASFFTCLAMEQSLDFTRRSCCDKCQHALSPLELIPLVSFLILKGSCRHCHAHLPRYYFVIELVGGIFGLSLYYLSFSELFEVYTLSLILFWLFWLSIEDYFHMEVSWWGLFILSVLCLLKSHSIWIALGIWLLLEMMIYCRPSAFGGADAKIMGLLALTLTVTIIPYFILIAACLGIVYITLQYLRIGHWDAIPFVPCIAISYLLCMLFS